MRPYKGLPNEISAEKSRPAVTAGGSDGRGVAGQGSGGSCLSAPYLEAVELSEGLATGSTYWRVFSLGTIA